MPIVRQVLELAKGNKSFAAIDRAIGKDSFKVVLLLRLSPLLPLAASNYLYGLTSVGLLPYVLGSWLGMLPGTLAYVSAGGDPEAPAYASRPPITLQLLNIISVLRYVCRLDAVGVKALISC